MVIQLLLPDYCNIHRLIKSGSAGIVSLITESSHRKCFFSCFNSYVNLPQQEHHLLQINAKNKSNKRI